MRIAVGIIGLMAGLLAMLQSCAITLGSDLAGDTISSSAGAIGILIGFSYVVGGAFAFALPTVSLVVFVIAGILGFLAASEGGVFTDLQIWAYGALILAALSFFARRKAKKTTRETASEDAPR